MSALAFSNIQKSFSGTPVLRGVTCEIDFKGITFIVGRSGSGKSVLCKLAVGLLHADAGATTLFGHNVGLLSERAMIPLRRRAPYIVQGPALLDWLTLEENVALAGTAAAAESALGRLGLLPFRARRPPEVGPGFKKRAAIARALVLAPEYLMLDEPTTGLDREAAGQVNDALLSLRSEGLGALVVSHDYAALEKMADRVLAVKDGVIGFDGTAREFLAWREATARV